MQADSAVVNLKEKTDYFYEIAFLFGNVLKGDNLKAIMPTILLAYAERFKMISDFSEGSSVAQNLNSLMRKLCNVETMLFKENKKRMEEVTNFKQQTAISSSYGAEDTTYQRKTKRVRRN